MTLTVRSSLRLAIALSRARPECFLRLGRRVCTRSLCRTAGFALWPGLVYSAAVLAKPICDPSSLLW